MARTRLTPFSRLLLFLLIFLPLAYLASAWYTGQDGLSDIKAFFGDERTEEVEVLPAESAETADRTLRLEELIRENEALKRELQEKDARIEELQRQLPDGN